MKINYVRIYILVFYRKNTIFDSCLILVSLLLKIGIQFFINSGNIFCK